jgi:hydroxymethylbilane synthase
LSKHPTIVIGTRGSELALWQAHWVEQTIKTTGDKILDSPLSKIAGKGLFTTELERALVERRIDLAVHSFKDIPTEIQRGLTIAAVCEREDVRDVFISHPGKQYKRLADVPLKGTIATGSLRRKSQLLHRRPDLTIVDIRGNLGTRIDKLKGSTWDGMLLAKAGVTRLGRADLIAEIFPPTEFLPAVGQGALAIETREEESDVVKSVHLLDHTLTRQATLGERALLRRLEGGCQIPIGAYGRIEEGIFRLDAVIGSLDGKRTVRSSIEGLPEESVQLGISLAEKLLAEGGQAILDEIRRVDPQ